MSIASVNTTKVVDFNIHADFPAFNFVTYSLDTTWHTLPTLNSGSWPGTVCFSAHRPLSTTSHPVSVSDTAHFLLMQLMQRLCRPSLEKSLKDVNSASLPGQNFYKFQTQAFDLHSCSSILCLFYILPKVSPHLLFSLHIFKLSPSLHLLTHNH